MKSNDVIISVIIPVYNLCDVIEKCLVSISEQSFQYWEAIIIDDNSTDSSVPIIQQYIESDSRFKLVTHEINRGVSQARRTGLNVAQGKYISFVDGDDLLLKDSLYILYSLVENTNADIAVGSYAKIGMNKVSFSRSPIEGEITPEQFCLLLLHKELYSGPCAKLYVKDIVTDEVLDVSSEIKRGEDWIMNLRIGYKALKIVVTNQVVYNYVQRENSTCHVFIPSFNHEMRCFQNIVSAISNYTLEEVIISKEITRLKSLFLYSMIREGVNIPKNLLWFSEIYQDINWKEVLGSKTYLFLFLYKFPVFRGLFKILKY